MNSEPCVRFGIRISPKIREKPADNRNNSPPKVMLLTVNTSQKVMVGEFSPSSCQKRTAGAFAAPAARLVSGFDRRVVARIDRLLEELLLVVSPELAHVVIGLDRLVDEFSVRLFEVADEEIPDNIAETVKFDRPARRIGERDRLHCGHKSCLVVRFAAGLLQARLDHHAVHVKSGAVEAWIHAVVLVDSGDETLVAVCVEVERIRTAAVKTKSFVPE